MTLDGISIARSLMTTCSTHHSPLTGKRKNGESDTISEEGSASAKRPFEQISEQGLEGEQSEAKKPREPVTFKVVYAKATYEVSMDSNDTIASLKDKIHSLTSVSNLLQKLCFKGSYSS